ncbi:MAG: flagellar biosynthesis anti-sigma factor FlgM [Burkholderiaceae bacterium]|nr:flagellar biosynthesis anti-sigma factor FlgM [Burkholderiaceae bacterium]MCX7901628.1 flagellar biosynthesis anti-sigma factor FlgM [Burkholderiaceae bacterium]
MKISPTTETTRTERVIAPADARTASARGADTPVPETERVQLSDLGARLAQLEAQFGSADFDARKVEEVRAAIAEGRLKINPEAIADKLLASAAELLGRKSG